MTNQDILKTLRAKLEKSITQVLKFSANDMAQFTCPDGTILSVDGDDIGVGLSVYTTDDNGNLTPAPDDTYSLDDGREITVVDGKIDTIGAGTSATGDDTKTPDDTTSSPDTADTNTAMAEDATAPTDAPATDTNSDTTDNSDLANRVSALEQVVSQLVDFINGQSQMNDQLMARVERLSKEPAAEGIKINKTGFNNQKINVNAELQSIKERRIEMEKSGMSFPS